MQRLPLLPSEEKSQALPQVFHCSSDLPLILPQVQQRRFTGNSPKPTTLFMPWHVLLCPFFLECHPDFCLPWTRPFIVRYSCFIFESPHKGCGWPLTPPHACLVSLSDLVFFMFIYLREREREGDTESKVGSRLRVVSTEPDAGLEPMNHEIMTWAKVRCFTSWATQVPQVRLCFNDLLIGQSPMLFSEFSEYKMSGLFKCTLPALCLPLYVWVWWTFWPFYVNLHRLTLDSRVILDRKSVV